MKKILQWFVGILRRWIVLFKQDMELQVEEFARRLEIKACIPPQLKWRTEEGGEYIIKVEQLDVRLVFTSAALAQPDVRAS